MLLHRAIAFPFVHDLAELATILQQSGQEVPAAIAEAARLTRFAVETRYPSLSEAVTLEDYKRAIAIAEHVILWVESKIRGLLGGPVMGGTVMRIEKVLSRGEGTLAQVLLVLVSTPGPLGPKEDLWVAIGQSQPKGISRAHSCPSTESARLISTAELQALDDGWGEGRHPFDLADHDNRHHWLARFDFTDHPDVERHWRAVVAANEKASPQLLNVIAWRSRLSSAPVVAEEPFEAVPGHASADLKYAEVKAQLLFELGVLFVHGIGDHGVRETLVRWAEPIVKVWRERDFAIDKQARNTMCAKERQKVSDWVMSHQLRNRNPIDGISQEVGAVSAETALVCPSTTNPAVYCAATRTEQTLFADLVPGHPSATLQRLSTVDTGAVLREAHVLFAEAYWTREVFPPTRSELFVWLTTAMPIAVWARLHRLVSTRPDEIEQFWQMAPNWFERIRVAVSGVLWLLQLIVMPAFYVVGSVAAQIAIGLISLLAILPIAWLQRVVRTVVAALLGTLGQSFALQTSPIRRSAIVSSVTNNLNWLSERCRQVVVISHSQGAEVARRVFLDARRSNVTRWYTVGSGIAPLSMVHPKSLKNSASWRVVVGSNWLLAVVTVLLLALSLDMIPGHHLGVGALLSGYLQHVDRKYFGVLYVIFTAAVCRLAQTDPQPNLLMRPSLLKKWWDFYASEDPVPGGSLIDQWKRNLDKLAAEDRPTQRRIFNTRVGVLDHTSYFHNFEEFVAPIAVDLLQLVRLNGDQAREQTALNEAAHRRDLRTWWNIVVSAVGLISIAGTVGWIAFGPAARSGVWSAQARRAAWSQGSGIWEHLGLWWSSGGMGQLIQDLWPALVILLALAGWWALCWWRSQVSVRTLIDGLAAAARPAAP